MGALKDTGRGKSVLKPGNRPFTMGGNEVSKTGKGLWKTLFQWSAQSRASRRDKVTLLFEQAKIL